MSQAKIGLYAALSAAFFAIFYCLAQILEWMGILGSGGGPDNPSTALGLGVLLTPSLLLAPAFLILMVCVYYFTPKEKKLYSLIGMAFADKFPLGDVNIFRFDVQLACSQSLEEGSRF